MRRLRRVVLWVVGIIVALVLLLIGSEELLPWLSSYR